MTAEFALRAELDSQTDCIVQSAGLIEAPHEIVPFVKDYLMGRVNLGVAMGIEHRDWMAQEFGHLLPLFSEIACQTVEPLREVNEVIPDWRRNEEAAAAYGCSIMDYIFDGMPGFVSRMHSFIHAGRVRS